MVLLKKRLPKRLATILEAVLTQLVMIAVVGPFFFIFFYMFWNALKPDYLFFEPGVWIFEPIFVNFTDVLENCDILLNIMNSVIRDVTKLNYPNQHDNTLCSLYRRYPPWN